MGRVLKENRKSVLTRIRVQRYRALRKQQSLNQNEGETTTVPQNEGETTTVHSGEVKLRIWALKHNITRDALCDLLKILISIGLNWLPADGRTLLETPKEIELKDSANGKLWFNGVRSNICQIFKNLNSDLRLRLNFNVDGLSPHKSNKHEFWPILANIHGNSIYLVEQNMKFEYVY